MLAHKETVIIGKDRRVILDLPEDFEEGKAEVIVLVSHSRNRQGRDNLEKILEDLASRPRRVRSKEEIDHYIEEERASWE